MRGRQIFQATSGVEYHFFFAKDARGLAVTVKHGVTPDEVIAAIEDGVSEFDDEHDRYHSMNETHEALWQWIDQGHSAFIISAWQIGE